MVDVVRAVADQASVTPAQVALAWLFAQGRRHGLPVVPIPGTRNPDRVEENAAAAGIRLTDEQVIRLDEAADLVQGGRNLTFNSDDWISANRE